MTKRGKVTPIRPEVVLANVSTINLTQMGDTCRIQVPVVLKEAKHQRLDEVLVIGQTDDGELWGKSSLNAGQSLWLLEKMRELVLSGNPWGIV